MKNDQLSFTYQEIYDKVIGVLITDILNNKKGYCVRDRHTIYEIGETYKRYKKTALKNMAGERLDRHKLSSCVCGAIVETKPLIACDGNTIAWNANEILGLYAGLSIIKYYMAYDFLKELGISGKKLKNTHKYLIENYSMVLPSVEENICDTQIYDQNFINALSWTHHKCTFKQAECFHYDIWAYSTIFYHLEIYNKPHFKKFYNEYVKGQDE